MNDPFSPVAFARHLGRDFRLLWRELLVFDVVFQMLRAWLIAPVIAVTLAFVLLRAGHVAVHNQDIFEFLLTPLGGLYVALLSVAAAALFLLEQAGLLAVSAVVLRNRPGGQLTPRHYLHVVLAAAWRVSQLGLAKMVLLLFALIPMITLALITYLMLLTGHDLYYYLNVRPPVFWIAAGIGSVLLLAGAVLGGILLVRWSVALPIILFEPQFPTAALAASRQRVRGNAWPIAKLLLGWLLGTFTIGGLATAGFRWGAAVTLSQFGQDSLLLLLLLLVLQAALLAILSFASAASLALIVCRLYRLSAPRADAPLEHPLLLARPEVASSPAWLRAASWLAIVTLVISPLTVWGVFTQKVLRRPTVLVTAHRGLARHAPENTLIALRKAIDIGADYAEIDVHQTQDGIVVLLHDRDLKRVAGDSRRLEQLTFSEVRELDVGSWFSPEFADQRVPTLEEAIDLCRGKIRLNIEIKVFGPAEPTAQAVARIVQEQHFEAECIVTSLSHAALQEVRRRNPGIPIGIIIGQSLGDVNRLDVDALSVRAEHLSDSMIRTAHQQQRQVMVWGMSGEQQMTRQLHRGVDNLITSDPALAMRLRDRWQEFSDHERLLTASRLLLGIRGN